nr:hypothetical protein CFP56_04150 [Quercus suber]
MLVDEVADVRRRTTTWGEVRQKSVDKMGRHGTAYRHVQIDRKPLSSAKALDLDGLTVATRHLLPWSPQTNKA